MKQFHARLARAYFLVATLSLARLAIAAEEEILSTREPRSPQQRHE